jgi:exosortase A
VGAAHSTATSAAWRRSGPAAVLALVALLSIFWSTTAFTVQYWEINSTYSHGYLIVPISLYLVWQCRAELLALTPRIQLWGLPLLLGLGILWALAYFIDIQLVMQLALLAAIGVLLWTLLGTQVSRRLAFPVGYLLLAIPIWSLLTTPLQEYTAIASTRVLRSFGVPVYLEAFYIAIPSGQFVVEEVCAGLRYFMATLCIATLFAYLNFRRAALGVLFVVVAIAISILMNWARVVVIILAGHLTAMEHFLVKEHIEFGWVMFVVVLVPIFFFGIWLQRFDHASDEHGSTFATAAASSPESARKLFTTVTLALVAVAIGPAALLAATRAVPMADVHLQVPTAAAPWKATDALDAYWGPSFRGPDAEVLAAYADNGARASLYIAYYARQRDGAELINEVNALYDEDRWQPRRHSNRRVALEDGTSIGVREIELVAGNGKERLVWYWYRVGDKRTTSPNAAKLWQLWNVLIGSPEGAIIAVSSPRQENLNATRADLERFVVNMEPSMAAAIGRVMAP